MVCSLFSINSVASFFPPLIFFLSSLSRASFFSLGVVAAKLDSKQVDFVVDKVGQMLNFDETKDSKPILQRQKSSDGEEKEAKLRADVMADGLRSVITSISEESGKVCLLLSLLPFSFSAVPLSMIILLAPL
jgi:hypothetical protein